MSQQSDDELYVDIVQRVSQQSKAVRLKVGALLVNDGVMVIGYNGTPKGWDNCCEDRVIVNDGKVRFRPRKLQSWVGKVEGFNDYNNDETPLIEFNSNEELLTWIKKTVGEGRDGEPEIFDNHVSWGLCIGFIEVKHVLKTKPEVIHAEANVFKKVANNPNVIKGGTLYVTHAPCTECAKLFLTMGLKRVVYLNKYRSDAGLELLRKDKIEVEYRPKKDDGSVKITDFATLLSVLPSETDSIGDNVVVEPSKTALDNLNSLIERLPVESHIPLGEGVIGFSAVEERLSVLPEEVVPTNVSTLAFASNEEIALTDVSVSGMSDTDRHLMALLLKESQGSA